ncbi:MAG: hypothetical protein CL565_02905 [Alphaproteobacteria bacterium]|nr:hypothetical protein [Alphaproteobacteria bacterium]
MTILVTDCPRCGATKTTFDIYTFNNLGGKTYNGKHVLEAFSVCRHCQRGTIFNAAQKDGVTDTYFKDPNNAFARLMGSLNDVITIVSHVTTQNMSTIAPPKSIPENVEKVFKEGAIALSGNCPNAACAMFRTCLDLASKDIINHKKFVKEPTKKQKDFLSGRLEFLFENGALADKLKLYMECVRKAGNIGIHEGVLDMDDANDLLDFTTIFLEEMYSEPAKIAQAIERTNARRKKKTSEV